MGATALTLPLASCDWIYHGTSGHLIPAHTSGNMPRVMSRIFPSLERGLRERVDYGISYNEYKGSISLRGENLDKYASDAYAIDGQLGTIVRVYREHQMSSNNEFLKKLWPSVRNSMQFIIDQDKDKDGLLEGRQAHTLDAAWYGPMGWISGMFLAALKASEQMAIEMGDQAFAKI